MLTRTIAIVALALVAAGGAALAAPFEHDQYSATSQTAFDSQISNTDLVQSGATTLASVTNTDTAAFSVSGLNDGGAGVANGLTYWNGSQGGGGGSTDVTFNLNTTLNPAGYNITSIDKFNGWSDSGSRYANQAFTVSYSLVGSPATFLPLATVAYTPTGFSSPGVPSTANDGSPTSSLVILNNNPSGTTPTSAILSGVAAIQFHFSPIPNTTGEIGVFREIDIFGSATIPTPEPSTFILGGLGLIGLVSVTRRRPSV